MKKLEQSYLTKAVLEASQAMQDVLKEAKKDGELPPFMQKQIKPPRGKS